MSINQPFRLSFSEHDLRHIRNILKIHAIESRNWALVRCAVSIYDRINEQLTEGQKNLLSGPPQPWREQHPNRRHVIKSTHAHDPQAHVNQDPSSNAGEEYDPAYAIRQPSVDESHP